MTKRPWQPRDPVPYPAGPSFAPPPSAAPAGPTGLEEGNDLPVYVGETFDKDEVARTVEYPQLRSWNFLGEGRGVGDGDVAVFGAVDHERRRSYVPNFTREVEAGPGHGLLVVGDLGRRVGETPAYELFELVRVLRAIRLRSRRLQTPPDHALGAEGTPPEHVRQSLHRHRLRSRTTVAGAHEHQTVYQVRPQD